MVNYIGIEGKRKGPKIEKAKKGGGAIVVCGEAGTGKTKKSETQTSHERNEQKKRSGRRRVT